MYISKLSGFKSSINTKEDTLETKLKYIHVMYKLVLYQIVNSVTNLGNNNFYYTTYYIADKVL